VGGVLYGIGTQGGYERINIIIDNGGAITDRLVTRLFNYGAAKLARGAQSETGNIVITTMSEAATIGRGMVANVWRSSTQQVVTEASTQWMHLTLLPAYARLILFRSRHPQAYAEIPGRGQGMVIGEVGIAGDQGHMGGAPDPSGLSITEQGELDEDDAITEISGPSSPARGVLMIAETGDSKARESDTYSRPDNDQSITESETTPPVAGVLLIANGHEVEEGERIEIVQSEDENTGEDSMSSSASESGSSVEGKGRDKAGKVHVVSKKRNWDEDDVGVREPGTIKRRRLRSPKMRNREVEDVRKSTSVKNSGGDGEADEGEDDNVVGASDDEGDGAVGGEDEEAEDPSITYTRNGMQYCPGVNETGKPCQRKRKATEDRKGQLHFCSKQHRKQWDGRHELRR